MSERRSTMRKDAMCLPIETPNTAAAASQGAAFTTAAKGRLGMDGMELDGASESNTGCSMRHAALST